MRASTSVLIAALAITVFTACEKLNDLISFDFSDSVEITIPAQTIVSNVPLNLATPEIQTSSQQAFSNNNTEAKYVKEAKLTELSLSITSPANRDFDFLNSIEIYISAEGQPEMLLASKAVVPQNVTSFNLDVTGANLKPYIQGESYSIRTNATVDEATSQEIDLKADMNFNVTAEVF